MGSSKFQVPNSTWGKVGADLRSERGSEGAVEPKFVILELGIWNLELLWHIRNNHRRYQQSQEMINGIDKKQLPGIVFPGHAAEVSG